MKPLINAILILSIISCIPQPGELYALSSLFFLNLMLHYRNRGARLFDDYTRSTVKPTYHRAQDYRTMMDGFVLKMKCSAIAAALLAAATLVECLK